MTNLANDILNDANQPLVSILMNCYNGEQYLRDAVQSVLDQTYQNWELICWDNQSTDKSKEIFKSYSDLRIKYFYAPTHTLLYEARNCAIERSVGEFIAFLDVDDWWEKDKLAKQIPMFDDPKVGLVCGNFWIFNQLKGKRSLKFKRNPRMRLGLDAVLKSYFVGLLTLVIRRTALESLSIRCNTRYHVIGDFDLVTRLLVNWKMDCNLDPVASYRWHGANESFRERARHIDELDYWINEVQKNEGINSSIGLIYVKDTLNYMKGIELMLGGKRWQALANVRDVFSSVTKIKLLCMFLMPISLLRFMRT